ncbi:KilA-N domain-containing protein [Cupriavidus sp. JZ107]
MSKALVKMEYQGIPVSFTDDGWFNATVAAKRFGKSPAQWLRLPDTLAYLEALQRKYGEITYLRTQRGAAGGTWLHPKLAVRFTQWLSIDFSIWCDEQIDRILRHEPLENPLADEPSTVRDRLPLYHAAIDIMVTYRLPFGRAYQAMNWYAGVDKMPKMSKAQANEVASFVRRLLAGEATIKDFQRIETNRVAIAGESPQLSLISMTVPLVHGR